jgi:hypothetical protein
MVPDPLEGTTEGTAISHEAALRLADRVSVGHDFGHGAVLARRHRNPDRTLGGWVADTAHADADAFVAEEASVFGNARVFGPCLVLGRARVMDFARVSGGSVAATARCLAAQRADAALPAVVRLGEGERRRAAAAWPPAAPGQRRRRRAGLSRGVGLASSPMARSSPGTPWSREWSGAT